MANSRPKPLLLLILDGWGIAPPSKGNAIDLAKKPIFDSLLTRYPVTSLKASGDSVGLNWGEMGNSEVGHLNCGSGMIVYQTLPRINKSIQDETFFENEVLKKAITHAKKNKSKLHLLGLVSNGGVHSHQEHLYALLNFCKKEELGEAYIHAILDGRDSKRDGGLDFIKDLQTKIKEAGIGKIATLSGRFYAMDRDNRWEREQQAYATIVEGKSERTSSDPLKVIKEAYSQENFDEEFIPTVITDGSKPVATIDDNDAVIFFNFRADRARQMTMILSMPGFEKFERSHKPETLFVATMTEYEKNLPVEVAFPQQIIEKPLAKLVAEQNMLQLHAAETEKYAHVTFFINGGVEDPFPKEDRMLVPSPAVATYDKQPEMSVDALTDKLVKAIKTQKHDFIIANFANPDMVGHTGVIDATIKGIEATDRCVGRLYDALIQVGGAMIITADHGNAEELINLQTGEIDKEHSTNPVPFILAGKQWEGQAIISGVDSAQGDLSIIQPSGVLADITPTILKLLDIEKPSNMTGTSLM